MMIDKREKSVFSIIIVLGLSALILSSCVSQPAPEEKPADPDVWALLEAGDTEKACSYFTGSVDVNSCDPAGNYPLHIAATKKNAALAQFFIGLEAKVDVVDSSGRTPLNISAELLDGDTAAVLVKAGADIHHSDGFTSPATVACENGRFFLNSILNDTTIRCTDPAGKTILHIGAETGRKDVVEIILEKKAVDLNGRDSAGKTALDICFDHKESLPHAETAALLILKGAYSENPLYEYFAPAVRSSNYNVRLNDGMASLHYTAREKCVGYTEFLIGKKADVNIKNASGATPLFEAVRAGHIPTVDLLLASGADVNTEDAKGNSVLHIAMPPDTCEEIISKLISRGAKANIRDEHGDSPLHIAVILNRSPSLIELLLSGDADVSIRNIDGKTALYEAVEERRLNLIPVLLKNRSDIFAADNSGITPFGLALSERPETLDLLITSDTVLQNDSQGNTALHIAVASRADIEVIRKILDAGATVNARNRNGDTPLHSAVRLNEEESGSLLLARGADIFAANTKGESPLYLVFPVSGKESELRKWMLTDKTLSARDGLGNTCLHYAAMWKIDNRIPYLVSAGANIEAANATGETPLFTAVRQNAPSTIKAFVFAGANLSSRDLQGNSLLHAAVRWNAGNSAVTLLDMGVDINSHAGDGKTPLHEAVRTGNIGMEQLLVSRGADLESRDEAGNTPFMEAVIAGFPDIMEKLVEAGSDPSARNRAGDTPLYIAVALERPDMATLLLGWGASIHARNSAGRTPFETALVSSTKMVRTLLTKDRLYSSDDNGSSPLHIAVREKVPGEMIKTIIEMGASERTLDAEGKTPLRLAVDLHEWETARIMADSGADVFLPSRDGKCPAEIALQSGEKAIYALFSGKAISSTDSSGNTILHYAAKTGDINVIRQLISLGANRSTLNVAKESPADIASRWNRFDAAALLKG